ncbi:hypothetical protein [Nonomuraea sp. NPDC049480]|uniref:hypothetical protein n=1 Tax=Nonomuraea sp. NPDC049480 TaxID=3364353 RepID=UPI00378CE30F
MTQAATTTQATARSANLRPHGAADYRNGSRHADTGANAKVLCATFCERKAAAKPSGSLKIISVKSWSRKNGRLLAYTAPWFAGTTSDPLPPRDHPDRRTFNLDMVATFVIYPSIPAPRI